MSGNQERGATALQGLCLAGPTAAGKTALALAFARALAPQRRVEVISVDSALVYRGMDIGTAKPSAAERAELPHHLVDILDPTEAYSAARFVADATRLAAEIRARGALPLLAGGTMLYFKTLREGLDAMPAADAALRQALDARAAREGWPALHAELARLDPQAAARIHANDRQRIQRALEVFLATGTAISDWQARAPRGGDEFAFHAFALVPADRAALHARIEERFAAMMAAGFLDEVRRLHGRGDLTPGHPAIRAVGYRQLWQHLDGECDLDTAIARAIAATRQLAKRQLTWLKSSLLLEKMDPLDPGAEVLWRARVAAATRRPVV